MTALAPEQLAAVALLKGLHGSPRENVPQPCLLHEGDARHYVDKCGGDH